MTSMRPLILMSYLLQASTSLVGAMCLYMAIDLFLLDSFIGVAVEIAVALLNAHLFVEQAACRRRLRLLMKEAWL